MKVIGVENEFSAVKEPRGDARYCAIKIPSETNTVRSLIIPSLITS